MLIVLLIALAAAAVGIILGKPIARYAARRATKVNPPVNLDGERTSIGVALQNPKLYPAVALLEPEMFVLPAHQEIWQVVKDIVKDANGGKDVSAKNHQELKKLGSKIPTDLTDLVAQRSEHAELVAELVAQAPVKLSKALKAGGGVLGGWEDRTTHTGDLSLTSDEGDDLTLRREYREPTSERVLFSRVALAVLLAASVVVCGMVIPFATTTGMVFGGVALAVLAVTGLAVALVDYDTLYLEMQTFFVMLGASFVPAALAALAEGRPGSILFGYLTALALGVGLVVINFLYGLVRKREAMGLGDSYIVLATLGVPTVVSGDYYTFTFAFLGGTLVGIASWLILKFTKRATKDTPFAFGPGLALGWIFAWPLAYLFDLLDDPISEALAPVLEPVLRALGII